MSSVKIIVHPDYAHLEAFVRSIPERTTPSGQMLHCGRNSIEKVTAPDGTTLVVKRYKKPTMVNQLVYSGLRWSKPRRSYEFALRFQEYGIRTADPVACIEVKKHGVFHTGYYISRFISDRLLSQVDACDSIEREAVLRAFARFTVDLHQKKVKHGDYNPNNVLFRYEDGDYRFLLIDINRVQFRTLSKRDCANEFRRLFDRQNLVVIAGQYALLRGWNPDVFCATVLLHRGIDLRGRFKKVLHFITGRKS